MWQPVILIVSLIAVWALGYWMMGLFGEFFRHHPHK